MKDARSRRRTASAGHGPPLPHWLPPLPGTPYRTIDAAARAALRAAAAGTIPTGREGAGIIYRLPDGTYSFTSPVWGTSGSVSTIRPNLVTGDTGGAMWLAWIDALSKNPLIEAVADYHNHGTDYHRGYEHFSPADTLATSMFGRVFGPQFVGSYLQTPTRAIHFADTAGGVRRVDPGFGSHIDTAWGRDPSRAPPEMPPTNMEGGATVSPIPVSPDRREPGTSRGRPDQDRPSASDGGGGGGGGGATAKPPESSSSGGNQPNPPAGAWGAIGVQTATGWGAWVLTWNGSAWGYVWTSPDGAPVPGPPPDVPADPQPAPTPSTGDDADDDDDNPDDDDDSGDGDGTVTGSGDDDDAGTTGGYVDPNDTTGTCTGGDESWRFHSNYLPMETRVLLGFAELARASSRRPPEQPSLGHGPTDGPGWQPRRGARASGDGPREGPAGPPPPPRGRLQNALADDAASRLMGGARIPRMGTDGPGQVPLNAAALAKGARPILRTVGDDEEAAAKASRDEVRQLLYNEHVAPIIRTMVGARDLAKRGAR